MAGLRVTVVKPVKPLRYRLSPVEEKLDNLDKLEKEFEQAVKAGKIPEEQRLEYALYLKVQRDRLQVTKDKALGLKPEVVKELIDMTGERVPTQWERTCQEADPQKAFKVTLFVVVLIWLYLQNTG